MMAASPPPAAPALSHDLLARLAGVIASRHPAAGGDPEKSYVARLFLKGTDTILKKVGEEATEVVLAGKDGDGHRIVCEVADLWFHTLVALAHFGLTPADVLAELARREGLSGLEEFARRPAMAGDTGNPANTASRPATNAPTTTNSPTIPTLPTVATTKRPVP